MIITNEYFYWQRHDMNDHEFLHWLRDRLINVYGEDPHIDFVVKLNELARKIEVNETSRRERH